MSSLITALRSLIRNKTMTAACISLVTVTLILFGIFLAAAANINHLSEGLYSGLTISAYTEPGVELTEEELAETKANLQSIPGVDQVILSTADQELQLLSESLSDDESSDDQLSNLFSEDNPLSNSFTINAKDTTVELDAINKAVLETENIESSSYGQTQGEEVVIAALQSVQTVTVAITIIFLVIVVFLISTTIKMAITARRNEIGIMRLVGATKFFIQKPFVIEGLIIGIIGGGIALGVSYYLYDFITASDMLILIVPSLLSIQDVNGSFFILPLVGTLIGIVSSVIAIRSNLKV